MNYRMTLMMATLATAFSLPALAQPGGNQTPNPAAVSGMADAPQTQPADTSSPANTSNDEDSQPAVRPPISPEVYRAVRPAAMRQFELAVRQANQLEKEIDKEDAHRLIYNYQRRYLELDIAQKNLDQATVTAMSIVDDKERALSILRVSKELKLSGNHEMAGLMLQNVIRAIPLVQAGEERDELLSTLVTYLYEQEQYEEAFAQLKRKGSLKGQALSLRMMLTHLPAPQEFKSGTVELVHQLWLSNLSELMKKSAKKPQESMAILLMATAGRDYDEESSPLFTDWIYQSWLKVEDPQAAMSFGLQLAFRPLVWTPEQKVMIKTRLLDLSSKQAKGWTWEQQKKQLAKWLMQNEALIEAKQILIEMEDPIERDGVLYDGITWLAKNKPKLGTDSLVELFDSKDYRAEALRVRAQHTQQPDPQTPLTTQPSE